MKNAVMKRVNEGKDIKQIGEDLCDGLKYPQKKIIAIIKEIKGKEYLNENKKRLNYRGGGGAGKPKAKKTELQNILPQAVLKNIESEKNKSNGDDEFEITQACTLVHDKRFDALNLKELDDERINKILDLLEPVIIKNKDILIDIRLAFSFGNEGTVNETIIYKNVK